MRRARKRPIPSLRPRNPVAIAPLLKKGGAHQRKDKRASRARQKAAWRKSGGE